MYVRWQSRKRRHSAYGPRRNESDVHWAAIAVENVRVDGKPTQRHITYLGGITESAIRIVHQRYYFWRKVEDELKSLGSRIGKQDRHRIKQAIARKVPRPTKAQGEQVSRDAAKWGVKVT
jgi:hypothetical protein